MSDKPLPYHSIIQTFCKEWIDWVDAGTPHGSLMLSTNKSLCGNLIYWAMERGYNVDQRNRILIAMLKLFVADGLDASLPFDDDVKMWYAARDNGVLHLNPKRVAWARKQAAKLVKENV